MKKEWVYVIKKKLRYSRGCVMNSKNLKTIKMCIAKYNTELKFLIQIALFYANILSVGIHLAFTHCIILLPFLEANGTYFCVINLFL